MKMTVYWNGSPYTVDTETGFDLSIPLRNGVENQPNAYGAPLFQASPVIAGNFTGTLEAGAPVNFFNVLLNPHGNGTHSECVGHILKGPYTIIQALNRSLFPAEIITLTPEERKEGAEITREQLEDRVRYFAEALIVRTLPNPEEKRFRHYTGSNSPWFSPDALTWLRKHECLHLLTDLPSVDPEVDGGALRAHKAFWDTEGQVREHATITEMIYVPEKVQDGLYLLDLHTAAFALDVSPSRPVVYAMTQVI